MSEGEGAELDPRRVSVGGDVYTVANFKGFKAFRLGRMLTELGEIGPKIQSKVSAFVAEYRKENVEEIARATLEFRYPADAAAVTDKAWEESGGVIKLARDPGEAEILAVALPAAFELAGERVVDLLAWVIADDRELEQKDDEGEEAIDAYIKGLRRKLLFRGDVDELLELALVAKDVLTGQMAGKAERARSLLALVGLGNDSEDEDPEPETEATEEDGRKPAEMTIEDDEKAETHSTSESQPTSQKPDSSTDSQPPTDGDADTSSTSSRGEPLASTSA
jgi:hypothetical protein